MARGPDGQCAHVFRTPPPTAPAADFLAPSAQLLPPSSTTTNQPPTMADVLALRARYEAAGQGHVFTFWDQLTNEQKEQLAAQLDGLDVQRVNNVYAQAIAADAEAAELADRAQEFKAIPRENAVETGAPGQEAVASELRALGLKAVAANEAAVVLMAGGQGTRLGSSAPKGCYDIGLPSHKSLFQLQAERILRLQQLAAEAEGKPADGIVVPWYIMTSGPTRKPTETFFAKNKYFGLEPENVVFFEQGTLPCLTNEGKIMLDSKASFATAPDGNGGLYAALRAPVAKGESKSVVSDMKSRGTKYIHCYGVDNCLVRVGDPIFLGACIKSGVPIGVKTVTKTDPAESVGVVALRDGSFSVIEYSELPEALAQAEDPAAPGQLAFRAANIVNHFYTYSFLAEDVPRFEEKMAFHIARKKIPSLDLASDSGELVKPAKPNGMKLERFVFDVFPYVGLNLTVHEVPRQEEFSPLKNAPNTGSDDPQTSRRDLLAQHARWLKAAGASLGSGVEVEVSPLVTYAGEGLVGLQGKSFDESTIVNSV